MTARSVQISLDDELLSEIDSQPETKKLGRSAVIRRALRSYLERKRAAAIDDSYRRAYEGHADEVFEEFYDLLVGQSWPDK
jgi:metal-responsive CopG/Arc/MetJ family transcriptional regulator